MQLWRYSNSLLHHIILLPSARWATATAAAWNGVITRIEWREGYMYMLLGSAKPSPPPRSLASQKHTQAHPPLSLGNLVWYLSENVFWARPTWVHHLHPSLPHSLFRCQRTSCKTLWSSWAINAIGSSARLWVTGCAPSKGGWWL